MTKITTSQTELTYFIIFFSELKDPRRTNKGNLRRLLSNILLLSVSAMLCGVNDWELVGTFGESQLLWLREHGSFKNGIPSTDTLERVFAALYGMPFNSALKLDMEVWSWTDCEMEFAVGTYWYAFEGATSNRDSNNE